MLSAISTSVIHRVSAHRPGDSGVFWLPPFHDMGLIGGIVQPVYAGLASTLMAPATFLQRPLLWLEHLIVRHRRVEPAHLGYQLIDHGAQARRTHARSPGSSERIHTQRTN